MKKLLLFAIVLCCVVCSGPSPLSAADGWTADPALVKQLSEKRPEFNYRESEVPEFELPDPLVFAGGQPVDAAEDWPPRREQTLQRFREHVYGKRPEVDYRTEFTVVKTIAGAFDGQADGREVRVRIKQGDRTYDFSLLIFLPAGAVPAGDGSGLPALLHINNRDFPTLQEAATQSNEFWPVQQITKRQYIAAAVSTKAIDPDRRDGFADGIRGFFAGNEATEAEQPEDAWGALSAWGWGASRALDYLQTVPEADGKRVAVIGHSRGGKTALWCAAEDARFAVAYSNDSGCGGAALSRRRFGETVQRITSSFPHWFCKKFADYGGRESELPVDQHQLIATIAPRPVYVASATEDLWADPRGEYLSLVHAAPVFQLLGVEAVTDPAMPAADTPRHQGSTGYHIRSGGHGLTPYDWGVFMDFVDKHLK